STAYLLSFAFDLGPDQVIGPPSWVGSESFDIVAKPSIAKATQDQLRTMVRGLLADRYGLKFHNVTKSVDVYLIEKTEHPHKLRRTATSGETLPRNFQL